MHSVQRHRFVAISLVLNLIGTVLLAYSFEIVPSDVHFVNISPSGTAICKGPQALITIAPPAPFRIGGACPGGDSDPAAVFKTNHPRFFYWGLRLIISSTLIVLWLELWQQDEELLTRPLRRRRQLDLKLKRRSS
jgi:hypothetical protein